jgi:hypothetical protein
VALYVEISCLAESTLAKGLVMRGFVVLVLLRWTQSVIVGRWESRSHATRKAKRRTVSTGLDLLTVASFVTGLWTAGYTTARNLATLKTKLRLTVQDRWMWSSFVLAARLLWQISKPNLGNNAPTLSRVARKNAERRCRVGTSAKRPAISETVSLAP